MYIYLKENSQTISESLKAYRETNFDYSNPEVSRLRVKDMPDDIQTQKKKFQNYSEPFRAHSEATLDYSTIESSQKMQDYLA